LNGVVGLSFVYFDQSDVVRHHLVQRIIQAYDEHKAKVEEQMSFLDAKAGANGTNGKPGSVENVANTVPQVADTRVVE
jgi:phosphate starvation-inducible PhoH-like protein